MPTFSLDCALEPWVERTGRVLEAWRGRATVGLVAEMDGRRVFFRQARTPAAAAGLARVVDLYQALRHPVLPPLYGHWQAEDGPTLVYEWVEGESLADLTRFLQLPLEERRQAVEQVFDLHLALAHRGFVSAGFGSFRYDYAARRVYVTRVEDYRVGPFRNWRVRQGPYAAPEETRRGARLDERTTVFHLRRLAQLWLGEELEPRARVGQLVRAWR